MRKSWIKYIAIGILIAIISFVIFFNVRREYFGEDDVNDIPIEYHVISMKVQERMKNIEENRMRMREKVKLNIFDAVNGDNVDFDNLPYGQTLDNGFRNNSKERKREIGCYLSHYGVYKMIETNGNKNGYTVVLEDDVKITSEDIDSIIRNTLLKMKEESMDFDILYIEQVSNNMGEKVLPNVCKFDKTKEIYGMQSYLVKNANVGRIIENTKTIDTPIDHKIFDAYREGKLNLYTFCPFLTTESTGFETTIHLKQ